MITPTAAAMIVIGLVAFVACFPQLLKLLRLKDASQFSISSWTIFLLYQLSSLIYAFSIASLPYIILNLLWVGFYATMLLLIVKYSRRK